jgi:NADH dehydrogenase (ubiquinone) 1 beta subcomplex subunit 3
MTYTLNIEGKGFLGGYNCGRRQDCDAVISLLENFFFFPVCGRRESSRLRMLRAVIAFLYSGLLPLWLWFQIWLAFNLPFALRTRACLNSHASDSWWSMGKKVCPESKTSYSISFSNVFFIRDAWRYQGIFSTWERFRPKNTFPGLGIGTAAFAVYLVFDFLSSKPSHSGHVAPREKAEH